MKFALSCALIALLAVSGEGVHEYASTIRPPAYPLAVRAPYSNYWLGANQLPGNWPMFWQGTTKGWAGIVRVDGQAYTYMGNVQGLTGQIQVAVQRKSFITPTQTAFVITAGQVELTVTFLSPVEAEDIQRQTIPLSYVFITARALDGNTHDVEVYMDISAEWAGSIKNKITEWSITEITGSNPLKIWSTELREQYQFAEHDDYAEWGNAVFVSTAEATHKSGSDVDVRKQFVLDGKLDGTNDGNFRCIECEWPTFGFAHNLGKVGSAASREIKFGVGHIQENNINLMGTPQAALWTQYWANQRDMIKYFMDDSVHAQEHAEQIDAKILTEAHAVGGQEYADIISLSLRQAFAGFEFSGTKENPVLYQKEISSNGNMNTVDVMYPAAPMHYYMNVKNLVYLMEPLFYQMEGGHWFKEFAIHDIGWHYPNVTGHADGDEEDMPVEESANMIMMVADYAFHPKTDVEEARTYVQKHFNVLSQWAQYLYYNCLYPVNQLTTDDFIGHTELNSGLALKGILGMKTFARLAEFVGDSNATEHYNKAVGEYVPIWIEESLHHSGTHLKMEYNVTEGYQFKYNAFHDKLLKLNTVPQEIYEMEAAFYLKKEEAYGVPFVSTHDYTKSDWEMWTAAAFGDANPALRQHVIENMHKYLRETPSREPFSDWYVTATGRMVGFRARPVVGGHFSLLALSPFV